MEAALAKRKPGPLRGPFNDWILETMKRRGINTLEEFAKQSGISRGTLYHLVRGRVSPKGTWVKPSVDTLLVLARFLERPIQDLIFRLEPDAPGVSEQDRTIACGTVKVFGVVGAGPGQFEPTLKSVYVPASVAKGRPLAAYEVRGDSMCGGKRPICDGDIIVVNMADKGCSGQVVVARLVDGSFVCKALKEDKFGRRLMSLNPLYTNSAPPVIPAEDVDEVIGRVVWVQGALNGVEE
ncbi:hypothetical protein SY28_01125 [Meiothermus taiwanensis]|nr:hypothetical protein SY28_01125 [Meiothermus taiwanensis]